MTDQSTVVHCKRAPFDVYIGRPGRGAPKQDEYPWGNPFLIGRHGSREHVVRLFGCWLQEPEQAELRERAIRELAGKRLGCWCSPLPCHGDVLAELVNSRAEQ